jgi:hypothetical protein
MAYFQNPFLTEFRGNWVLGDRQYSVAFVCPPNTGRSDLLVNAWNPPSGDPQEVYDLSGNDADGNPKAILNVRMSTSGTFDHWANVSVDLINNTYANLNPAPTASAIRPDQIVAIINADPTFSSFFTASLHKSQSGNNTRLVIRQKQDTLRMKFFVLNGQAEEVLGFNARAGVAQLPVYFAKCKVWGGDMTDRTDGTNALVLLDPSNSGGSLNVDNAVIDNAVDERGNSFGFDSTTMKEDWELLGGRVSGLFTFQKLTVDGSDRITQIIEYPAGAVAGDFARKINYTYTSSNTNPSQVTEVPYVLTDGDLVTP